MSSDLEIGPQLCLQRACELRMWRLRPALLLELVMLHHVAAGLIT